ncbi:hypothetical protein [Streptomyces javensis]|uniref:Uncharacterized protein n=1 Tax=Streptomyces javensis TaxID=114698 RepID=A0ABS0R5Q7_9ACTN|nr:hypothetical protein [Streptomyces javensis]MBI0312067.1 hypothetical protein [Streptomyces javensis]
MSVDRSLLDDWAAGWKPVLMLRDQALSGPYLEGARSSFRALGLAHQALARSGESSPGPVEDAPHRGKSAGSEAVAAMTDSTTPRTDPLSQIDDSPPFPPHGTPGAAGGASDSQRRTTQMTTNQQSRPPQGEPPEHLLVTVVVLTVMVVILVCTATVYVLYQHPSLTAPVGVGVGLLAVLVPLAVAACRR